MLLHHLHENSYNTALNTSSCEGYLVGNDFDVQHVIGNIAEIHGYRCGDVETGDVSPTFPNYFQWMTY